MKNKYLDLTKLSKAQFEHVLNLLPDLTEDDYLNTYDITDTHNKLIKHEMGGGYGVVSSEFISHRGYYSEISYSSFCSLFGAVPVELSEEEIDNSADGLLREVVSLVSGDYSDFALRSLVDRINNYLNNRY